MQAPACFGAEPAHRSGSPGPPSNQPPELHLVSIVSRDKLLEAAAQVFAESGFRGATTRRIAEVAGVNEVTLFRLFGSKSQLLTEAMACVHPQGCVCALPAQPGDVEQELVEWSSSHLAFMRGISTVIRRTMAELDEHPEMRSVIAEAKAPYLHQLFEYASKVRPPETAADADMLRTACAMLSSSIFADAIGRDVVPAAYPEPESEAARKYVEVFLSFLGIQPSAAGASRRAVGVK
ncbi:MAG: TetR/AcrR family transcriptional regulator [Gemmatimonadetes bacterium]|nr:TetR/AcrR family transcriptional regulator [Gemmatimonadota bacterium]